MRELLLTLLELRADLVNDNLGFKVPDLDARCGSSAQPVSVRGENKGVDDVTSVKRVKSLAFGQVPKHSNSVLSAGSTEGSIRRYGDYVEVARVALKVRAELAVAEVPYLDELVPASGNNERILSGRRESDARNPLSVAIVVDGELAFSKGVPKLNRLISGSRNDLSVVVRESHRENILSVSNKSSGGYTSIEVPKAEGSIPRSRESELTVR